MRLENKVAIVTGAGRNIGEDIAKTFAQEGACVAVVDLDKGRGERGAGEINAAQPGRALSVICDVSSSADVERMRKPLLQKWEPVDIPVHTAAWPHRQTILDLTEE